MQPNTRLIILNYYTKEIVDAFTNHYQFFHSHSVNSCTTAQFTYQSVYKNYELEGKKGYEW